MTDRTGSHGDKAMGGAGDRQGERERVMGRRGDRVTREGQGRVLARTDEFYNLLLLCLAL